MKRTNGFRKNNLIYEEIHKNECLCCSINNAGTEVTLVSLKVRIKKTRNSLLHCEKIAFLHIVVVVDYVDIMSAWSLTTDTISTLSMSIAKSSTCTFLSKKVTGSITQL